MNPFEKFNSAPDVLDIRKWMQQQAAQKKQAQQQPQQQQKKGNFLTSLIPSGGGIAGAAGGAALGTAIAPGIGTLLGALLGGAAGGGAGKVAENAVEGQSNLGQGVGQEALINGVLGAGPLRLLKGGADIARGVKAGTGLADAVTSAGSNAVNQSVRGTVGNKLTNASNDLVVKNFRLNPSQLGNFKNKFGEDASQTIKKYGLVGQDAAGIQQKAIQPLQGEFDSITHQIPSLPTADVLQAFKAKYQPLLDSAVEDKQAIGQQLKAQADTLAKKYGAEIPSGELAGARQEFDSLVNYADKAANPARYGVNKLSADAIRNVLQQAADKTGLKASNGMSFKQVGQELSKLHQLTDNIAKQEQLGRGSLPAGLGNVPGAIVGSAGGVPGALVGTIANAAVNSPTGRTVLSNVAERGGAALTKKAAAVNPYSIGSLTKRLAPVGAAQGLADQPSLVNSANAPNTTTIDTNMNNNSNMDTSYTNGADMSSAGSDQGSPYSQQNLMSDIQRDPKNAEKYLQYYQDMQKAFASPATKPLNATQLQQANNANSGLGDLQTIAQEIQQDPSVLIKDAIPGGGLARRLTGTNNYEAAKQNVVDVISRLRSGAAITQDEANRYMGLLPGATDTADSAVQKLQRLSSLLSSFSNPQAAQPDASSGGDLLSALMSAQGGY